MLKVININKGRNKEIAKRCKTLAEYSAFIEKVREFEKESKNREEAMKKAIIYCCEQDILKEFLEQNGTEVMNMLITEWKMEDALVVRYEEGLEDGLEKGMEKGREEGREEGKEEIARKALAEGVSFELIQSITGLDIEVIKSLSN